MLRGPDCSIMIRTVICCCYRIIHCDQNRQLLDRNIMLSSSSIRIWPQRFPQTRVCFTRAFYHSCKHPLLFIAVVMSVKCFVPGYFSTNIRVVVLSFWIETLLFNFKKLKYDVFLDVRFRYVRKLFRCLQRVNLIWTIFVSSGVTRNLQREGM